VPSIVVGAQFDLTGTHRQKRLTAVKRLDLAFFINAQHDRALGRGDVKTDNITHFFDEERIGRQLERLTAMRLQSERSPDALHTRYRNPYRARHAARTPMRSPHRRAFERLYDYGLNTLVRDRARRARPCLVMQAIHAPGNKATVPLANGRRIYLESGRDTFSPGSRAGGQHNACPQRYGLGGLLPPRKPLQFSLFLRAQNDRW